MVVDKYGMGVKYSWLAMETLVDITTDQNQGTEFTDRNYNDIPEYPFGMGMEASCNFLPLKLAYFVFKPSDSLPSSAPRKTHYSVMSYKCLRNCL
ncbi:unnamed protein product [Prunus armeniaca]|uniref:Uncharacterized protein n=1 Tax=Prunus armeniaca TaxID=36596 RepID=A0A6J5ULJ4_PRUAR|nr:unnamed protein product [Prunus armeniaca]